MANLSRSYRPQLFSQIAGQRNVTQTLSRQVEMHKIGHAYLFSGPRGIGKTTAARIFAKAVNCLEPKAGEPCLACKACQKAAVGSMDIIEMDAASNTGVDNVREAIVEHVRFVPAELKYKVYIIDEAHMLSTSAWNAHLKTLEEPQEHSLFIFATTEKHKVPATIVSRCQRLEFRRIAEDEIVKRLKDLAEREKTKVDEPVFGLIADRSEGCLRDAENLLGQLISLGDNHLTSDMASLIIPASQIPQAVDLLQLAGRRDVPHVLNKIQDLEQEGAAFVPIFDDMLEIIRSLMLIKAASSLMEEAVVKLQGLFTPRELLNISLMLMERRKDVKNGIDARFAMELAMVAIASGATMDQDLPSSKQELQDKAIKSVKAPEVQTHQTSARPPDASKINKVVSSDLSLNDVRAFWPKLLDALENNRSLLFILKLCSIESWDGHCLNLGFQYPYHQQTILNNQQNKLMIENKLRELTQDPLLTIQGTIKVGSQEPEKDRQPKDTVSSLISVFGGQVVT